MQSIVHSHYHNLVQWKACWRTPESHIVDKDLDDSHAWKGIWIRITEGSHDWGVRSESFEDRKKKWEDAGGGNLECSMTDVKISQGPEPSRSSSSSVAIQCCVLMWRSRQVFLRYIAAERGHILVYSYCFRTSINFRKLLRSNLAYIV